MGADGLKTGHTKAAGYGLTASVERAGRRLVLVINGLTSSRKRTIESQRVIEWGFREYVNHKIYNANDSVTNIDVWLGKAKTIPAIIETELLLTIKRSDKQKMKMIVNYEEPIITPISKGQKVGTLKIQIPQKMVLTYPLVSAIDVEQLNPFQKIFAAMNYLVWGSGD